MLQIIAANMGADSRRVRSNGEISFPAGFAGLGNHLYMPVRSYSSGMRSRLAFGISMSIQLDTYLVDEVTSVGDRCSAVAASMSSRIA